MGKDKQSYKDKHGHSRVGGFLKSIGKGDILWCSISKGYNFFCIYSSRS